MHVFWCIVLQPADCSEGGLCGPGMPVMGSQECAMGCCSSSASADGGLAWSAEISWSPLLLRLLCPEARGGGGSCC